MLISIQQAAGVDFWPSAAQQISAFMHSLQLPLSMWHSSDVVLPSLTLASSLRTALAQQVGDVMSVASKATAWLPPRMHTAFSFAGLVTDESTARRAQLYAALRANPWVRESFGQSPGALWAVARDIDLLSQELTLAAIDQPEALAERFTGAINRYYGRQAQRHIEPQAALVLQLWRALQQSQTASGASALLAGLAKRADSARQTQRPLIWVSACGCAGWEKAFVERYAQAAPVLLIEGHALAVLNTTPLLLSAWPELASEALVPLTTNAKDALRSARPDTIFHTTFDTSSNATADATLSAAALMERILQFRSSNNAPTAALTIFVADSLEDEASAAAQAVLDALQTGVRCVALVALDRLAARRTRALLERAEVMVRDEAGWTLATTSAAGAVMHWLDLIQGGLYWRDLLDWLRSPFSFADVDDKSAAVMQIELAVRAAGALRGLAAIRAAAQTRAVSSTALKLLAVIEQQVNAAQQSSSTLRQHAERLLQALQALGLRVGLAQDPVGREVLAALESLPLALQAERDKASLGEFRALLAQRFEDLFYADRSIDSSVVLTSLAATRLRQFDAAVLIGADAAHLPSRASELLFLSNSVRAELGLATTADNQLAQTENLALLIANTPHVCATWRRTQHAEPNPLSPLLDRLARFTQLAGGPSLFKPARRSQHRVSAEQIAAALCKRPAAVYPAAVPQRLSASSAQSLVNCAYQFYARHLLGLSELAEVIETAEKREYGQALHQILLGFHQQWQRKPLHLQLVSDLQASLRQQADQVFTPLLAQLPNALGWRARFDAMVDAYIAWAQQRSQDGWQWSAGEVRIEVPLTLGSGRSVNLVGRIDRIDRLERIDRTASAQASDSPEQTTQLQLEVLDYKTRSATNLKSSLAQVGEDIQLAFYGLLLAQQEPNAMTEAAYLSVDGSTQQRAAVKRIALAEPLAEAATALRARLVDVLSRIDSGAPLTALGASQVCTHCEMRGLCRRPYWNVAEEDHLVASYSADSTDDE